jgi:hypothetical protein
LNKLYDEISKLTNQMKRFYYSSTIDRFLHTNPGSILGELVQNHEFPTEQTQRDAWLDEIKILQQELQGNTGSIFIEYSIPRMGKRIDAVCIIGPVIFVLEFKIGAGSFTTDAIDQVTDYALDLKNFHQTSHDQLISPILISTKVEISPRIIAPTQFTDKLFLPLLCNAEELKHVINNVLAYADGRIIDPVEWQQGRYSPTPTIVEAAIALYRGHSVEEISRSDASAINLTKTSNRLSQIVQRTRDNSQKAICFVTGVPGSGKTLVGLNIATTHIKKESDLYSVFLSGNGPLVAILREALTRNKVKTEKERGYIRRKGVVMSEVKMFIQNVHHFRDECLIDLKNPPLEHVVLFDEAQRAWDLQKTAKFMRQKKNTPNFNHSEPEFLISCLDRHSDWAVIICLVGGGQEINDGEAGISEWIEALDQYFPKWQIYISPHLSDNEYGTTGLLKKIAVQERIKYLDELHLSVSMRSFRAEYVSLLVKQILDLDISSAKQTLALIQDKYPIVLTRSLQIAKKWLKDIARGSERYGIIVSSQAERLKPYAINVKSSIDPIHWFLDGKEDVRSSFYLEDVATEFDVQGLELDWACVTWDADFRYSKSGWQHRSFVGDRWNMIKHEERKKYQKNAYRVLLTRARQGMVIVVPEGDTQDPTRDPGFYNPTFEYLESIGLQVI